MIRSFDLRIALCKCSRFSLKIENKIDNITQRDQLLKKLSIYAIFQYGFFNNWRKGASHFKFHAIFKSYIQSMTSKRHYSLENTVELIDVSMSWVKSD